MYNYLISSMNKESIKTIKNNTIRRHWDENSQKWYFSIVDVVGIIAPTSNPRNYWKVLKSRLKKAQNQLVTECNQLKIQASDGKFYLTDVGDKKMILKMVKTASPETLPYFEGYFNNLEHKKDLHMVSLKKIQSVTPDGQKYTYPQSSQISKNFHDLRIKNPQPVQQKKIKMKSI